MVSLVSKTGLIVGKICYLGYEPRDNGVERALGRRIHVGGAGQHAEKVACDGTHMFQINDQIWRAVLLCTSFSPDG